MKQVNVFILAKRAQAHHHTMANMLAGRFFPTWISDLSTLTLSDEKPLLQPPQLIMVFVDDWSEQEMSELLQPLTSVDIQAKLFSLLFIVNADAPASLSGLMKIDDDFINIHCHASELILKIEQLLARSDHCKKLARDLREASDIALLSMSHSSELGEISRFILASYNCRDYETLIDALFETIVVFGVSCSALIVVDDSVVSRLSPDAKADARNIMLKSHDQGRIHRLGRETIVTFPHASIMVHNMPLENDSHYGRLLDNLAVLGNCFEARVKGIHAEQKADAASRAKTMFLATMSHELRTPMNSVIGFTERLIEKLNGRLNEREEKQLHAIKRNGDHLLSVINDILDISKIEVGKMEIHPENIDVIKHVGDIFLQLQPIAQNHQLELLLSASASEMIIEADPTRFTQMVMNLASNAIKYTPKGSVKLIVEQAQDAQIGECARISVQDTGIGISKEDQEKLFGSFVQIDSALSRKVEGTGLGLAISMIFANMHGGRIDVESEVDVGSCFSLFLPKAVKNFSLSAPPQDLH